MGADIVILENEALFDSRNFKKMDDYGRLLEDQFLSLLSYMADQERKKIRTRQREGIDLALAQGKKYGRPQIELSERQKDIINDWFKNRISAAEAARRAGLNRMTLYRKAALLKEKGEIGSLHEQESLPS